MEKEEGGRMKEIKSEREIFRNIRRGRVKDGEGEGGGE